MHYFRSLDLFVLYDFNFIPLDQHLPISLTFLPVEAKKKKKKKKKKQTLCDLTYIYGI